jgi:hypothetical protein
MFCQITPLISSSRHPKDFADQLSFGNLSSLPLAHILFAISPLSGLFNNSRGVALWNSRDYLPDAFGDDVLIPVVKDASLGTLQDHREIVCFFLSSINL